MSDYLETIKIVNQQRAKVGLPPLSSSRPATAPVPPTPGLEGVSELAKQWLGSWVTLKHPAPRIEHHFHPERQWRFDFAWPDALVAVEVHGGIWKGGRHTRGKGFAGDREKVASAQELGWLVYEVTDVTDTRLMDRIAAQIQRRQSTRPRGRGGK
jgi:hypothetical protein